MGLSTAALLSNAGYKVYLLDINHVRLDVIKEGRSFFYEKGIDPLLEEAVEKKVLIPTDSYESSVPNSSIVFSCVGTPDNPDGSSNLNYVFSSAEQASKFMRPGSIFVQKSTVPVGTGAVIEKQFAKTGKKLEYVSNPEFLREGTAITDSLWFDRVVVGGSEKLACQRVINLYKQIEKKQENIAAIAGLKHDHDGGKYFTTNRNSAELIKVTANAFLALKISFANSIAKLADHTGADVVEVMDAVGADKRIGRAFLSAGRGYGGGCFPKDVSGLICSASEHGVDLQIMTAASDLNETMPGYIANKAQEVLGGLKKKKVTVLGLSFKEGTSDARRSPGVKLANILAKNGAIVSTYDPQANSEASQDLRKGIKIHHDLRDSLEDAQAVFITTEWPEFFKLNPSEYNNLMAGNVFVDSVNGFDMKTINDAGLKYVGVGRG